MTFRFAPYILWVWDNESGYNPPISFLIEDLG